MESWSAGVMRQQPGVMESWSVGVMGQPWSDGVLECGAMRRNGVMEYWSAGVMGGMTRRRDEEDA